MKNKKIINDGFNADLVTTALFEGILEIPIIPVDKIIIPENLIPFTKMNYTNDYSEFIHFYEHDEKFFPVIHNPYDFTEKFKKFRGIISLDASLYIDMPLVLQLANIYISRAIGYYYYSQGIYVIPNVRWGDERTYSKSVLPEAAAFLGIPKNSIVSIGTYGCIRGEEKRYHFKKGLEAMIDTLTPKVVIVYGSMPPDIFNEFKSKTTFIQFDDWTKTKRRTIDGNR